MLVVMVFTAGSAVAFAVAALSTQYGRQAVRRLTRIGAHRAISREWPTQTSETENAAHENQPTARVVSSCRVTSDRLMDAPTGRLHPSTRHRVPPWVTKN
ncbi:hypothetical protein OWR29_09885 [Actinoplanes sp. Pm04-4]|uniref:Secreted protein n=1 Tax=Paractinoplanes pyxinae TaxID=2997416 RepID=A0ABT4AVR6_9ACTN|nr:hypothetical protein [Actinoplanes pyxinae]MCY1138307.1 hypothetical protein [Actinoplanes pyxinae]